MGLDNVLVSVAWRHHNHGHIEGASAEIVNNNCVQTTLNSDA